MRRLLFITVLTLAAAACGSSPSSPTPNPTPSTVAGTVVATNGGQAIAGVTLTAGASTATTDGGGGFQLLAAPGARVSVTGAGVVTRTTALDSRVDVIRQADGFDLSFYRQFVRNTLDAPSGMEPLRRLTQSPSIYLQRTGLSDGYVAQLQQTARDTITALTGGTLSLASWETGTAARAEAAGWIVVELRNDEAFNCGNSLVGQAAGHIWLNTVARCRRNGEPVGTSLLLAHELGHALGFWHVDAGLMNPTSSDALTERERYHAAIAYRRPVGNTDPDTDPSNAAILAPMVVQ